MVLKQEIKRDLSISNMVNMGLQFEEALNRRGQRLYASSVGLCPRRGALEATAKGLTNRDAAFTFYVEVGKLYEDIIIQALKNQGSYIDDQMRVFNFGIALGGYIDIVARENGIIRIVEVKTCGNTMPNEPKKPHLKQAALYSAIMGLPYTVLYMSRNVAHFNGELKIKQFNYDFNYNKSFLMIQSVVYADLCVKEGILPDKHMELKSGSDCGFCSYTDYCWNNLGNVHLNNDAIRNFELLKEANAKTKAIMKPENVEKRRQSFLNALSKKEK